MSNMETAKSANIQQPTLSAPLKNWLSPTDLEQEFEISISTQNKMRMKNAIPYSKVGKFVRYSRVKINQWLENAEVSNGTGHAS